MEYDVCIIGMGAAGLTAASCLNKNIKICIIDRNEIPGRKILATGGGRCNITNVACDGKDETLGFFAYLGLETYCDSEGRYYPYTNRASDVVETLMRSIGSNVTLKYNCSVDSIVRTTDGFVIDCDSKKSSIKSRKVIIACGGKAAPQFGTKGDGYAFARSFGHKVTKVFPILTGIETPGVEELKGIRCRTSVKLIKDEKCIREEQGELQFTEYGLSGICIFNLTPFITSDEGENFRDALKRYSIRVDFAPDFSREEISRRKSSFGIVTNKLADWLETRVEGVVSNIKAVDFTLSGIRGWRESQCSAGGVSTSEINMDTMESKLVENLYFVGEILDVQGPCGGFNLQNAWETGMKAAYSINREN